MQAVRRRYKNKIKILYSSVQKINITTACFFTLLETGLCRTYVCSQRKGPRHDGILHRYMYSIILYIPACTNVQIVTNGVGPYIIIFMSLKVF
jgi:hypothetical protein